MDREKIAREFAMDLKGRFGDRIQSVILFGSVAKGEENEESDIDILIVSRGHVFRDLKEPIGSLLKRNVLPEVINLTQEEFERMRRIGSPFYHTIKEEGVKIA